MPRVAVLILACQDYEAFELTLACHMKYTPADVPYFILQNCRGTYDADRTLGVARRYQSLFPTRITIIEAAGKRPAAYRSIAGLLQSEQLAPFDLVCKVDDDAFPIARGWLEGLLACWQRSEAAHGQRLAYVTPLINNNTWGFSRLVELMGLTREYHATIARPHRVGAGADARLVDGTAIVTGAFGTIWGAPYIARWVHEKSSLLPDAFIAALRDQPDREIPAEDRYSIGCILFRPSLWSAIDDGTNDDERMMHDYCRTHRLKIVCAQSIPMVHVAYFSQREENRDLVERMRLVYEPRLGHPFPIALRPSRLLEIEARLRWQEAQPKPLPLGSRLARKLKARLEKLGLRRPRGPRSVPATSRQAAIPPGAKRPS